MKLTILFVVASVGCSIFLYSCLDQNSKDERLAKQYCAGCHVFPEPDLLDKLTWENSVLPQMSFHMGIDYSQLFSINAEDQPAVMRALPQSPVVGLEDWESIKRYYLNNSPDTIHVPVAAISRPLKNFKVEAYPLQIAPFITFVKSDTSSRKILIGTRHNKLYRLNEHLVTEDSFLLSSPPSHIMITPSHEVNVSLMGIMDPNDQAKGQIVRLSLQNHTQSTRIDSLKRPVHFEIADLDHDGLDDIIVSCFGNYSGALIAYQNKGNGHFKKHILQPMPGARKVIIRDFDNNGTVDILALMSQGDERIILLLNQGNFQFRLNTILNFPPVYGSSFFDIADFNQDGKFDILYTNGDNADYSMILKPYHGVRIFLNNGNNDFKESWFYNMHGASQAIARDFDLDGDLDIAAISFFPDFKNSPQDGFIYFENAEGNYIPHTTLSATLGRWLTLEAADIDHDGDCDLMLGALDFSVGVPEQLRQRWKEEKTSILLLRNTIRNEDTVSSYRDSRFRRQF
jgi:hypothetical protein